MPSCLSSWIFGFMAKKVGASLTTGGMPAEYGALVASYLRLQYSMPTTMDTAQLLVQKPPGFGVHSMVGEDRLGGPLASKIPTGIVFGDQDVY